MDCQHVPVVEVVIVVVEVVLKVTVGTLIVVTV